MHNCIAMRLETRDNLGLRAILQESRLPPLHSNQTCPGQPEPRGGLRAFAAYLLAFLLTACVVPPTPSAGCSQNTDCPSGVCQGGVCLVLADTGAADGAEHDAQTLDSAQADAAVDTSPEPTDVSVPIDSDAPDGADAAVAADGAGADGDLDGLAFPCLDTADCELIWATPQPCVAVACQAGQCVFEPQPLGSSCTVAGPCGGAGACSTSGCLPATPVCDDGESCTLDVCTLAGCKHVAWSDGTSCSDPALPCRTGTCSAGKCALTLQAGTCLIDGICRAANARMAASGDASCWQCDPSTDAYAWSPAVAAACDDAEPCTESDRCSAAAQCAGESVVCAPGGPCKLASCVAGKGCVQLAALGPCTDGDPCTTADTCVAGACVGAGVAGCSDGNPCTADACVAGAGCVHTPVAGACTADNNPCTDDVCVQGACAALPLANVCQIAGICVPAGAAAPGQSCLMCDPSVSLGDWSPRSWGACDDGNACTLAEQCESGSCTAGALASCDDGNACTADACLSATGCVHTSLTVACDDGNPCTVNDSCASGACAGSQQLAALACEDGNPCTTDSCHPYLGCSHAPASGYCDDGVSCTLGDHCVAGRCAAGSWICPCTDNQGCEDGDACTTDTCSGGWCAYVADSGASCDDGDACTSVDACLEGLCVGLAVTDCDDNQPCTLDGCVADTGCWTVPTAGQDCDDGSLCTMADRCDGSGVCAGLPGSCDDGNECTVDVCDPATAGCAHVALPNGAACFDDGVPCSLDRCEAGVCAHSAVVPGSCWIDGVCWAGAAMHPSQPCLRCEPTQSQSLWSAALGAPCSDGNACTAGDACGLTGSCEGNAIPCDDGNPCTTSVCNPLASSGACQHLVRNGPCSDGDACTTGDTCADGACVGAPTDCDDQNPCTIDLCGAKPGCVHFAGADGVACADDGVSCTLDRCSAGECVHPVASGSCLIEGTCVAAGAESVLLPCVSCEPAVSTNSWSPTSGAPCTDGNVCTSGDLCVSGTCVGEAGAPCNDSNPCTIDACDGVLGCVYTPTSASFCDDGDACTEADSCTNGLCTGLPVDCDTNAEACEVSWCDAKLGCRIKPACGPLDVCSAGLCVTGTDGIPGPVVLTGPAQLGSLGAPSVLWEPQSADATSAAVPNDALSTLWIAAEASGCEQSGDGGKLPALVRLASGADAPDWQVVAGSVAGGCARHPVLQRVDTGRVLFWESTGGPCGTGKGRLQLRWLGDSDGNGVAEGPCAPLPTPGYAPSLLASSAPWRWLEASSNGMLAWSAADGVLADAQPLPLANEVPLEPITIAPDQQDGQEVVPSLLMSRAELDSTWRPPTLWEADPLLQPLLLDAVLPPVGLAQPLTLDVVSAAWDSTTSEVVVALGGRTSVQEVTHYFVAIARISVLSPAPAVAQVLTTIEAPNDAAPMRALRVLALTGPGWPQRTALLAFGAPSGGPLYLARTTQPSDGSITVTWPWPVANVLGASSDTTGHGDLSELRMSPDGKRFAVAFANAGKVLLWTLPLQP